MFPIRAYYLWIPDHHPLGKHMKLARIWREQLRGGQPARQRHKKSPYSTGFPFRATNQVQVHPAWGRGRFSVPAALN